MHPESVRPPTDSSTNVPTIHAPILGYATAPVDALVVEQDAHHLRLTVPPARHWRTLPKGYRRSLIALSLWMFWVFTQLFAVPKDERVAVLGPIFIIGFIILLILLAAFLRLQTWFTFIITADDFFLHRRLGRLTRSVTRWPRSSLLEVRHNPLENRLILRLHDQDPLDLRVSQFPEVTAQVARHLQEARTAPLQPSPAPTAPVQAATATSLHVITFVVVAYLLFTVLLFVKFPPAGVVALYVGPMILAIPLGIWLGTQKKDIFL